MRYNKAIWQSDATKWSDKVIKQSNRTKGSDKKDTTKRSDKAIKQNDLTKRYNKVIEQSDRTKGSDKKAFLHDRSCYSNRISIRFSKKWKKRIRLVNSQCKEEQKVIHLNKKAEKGETTNDDFVNESFPLRLL